MTFAFTHEERGLAGSVEVVVTPDGAIPTAHSSGTELDLHDAQQFVSSIASTNLDDFFSASEIGT